jgi:hypothetical protein
MSDLVEWTLTNMTFVPVALFLIGIVAAILRTRTRSAWFAAATFVSELQIIGFLLAMTAGRIGDWAEEPFLYATGGAVLFGVITAIATMRAAGVLPRWQWRTQIIVAAPPIVFAVCELVLTIVT